MRNNAGRRDVVCDQHPDQSVIQLSKKESKFRGYYLIARHYRWALNQVFHHFNFSAAIIVEGSSCNCPYELIVV